MTAILVPATPDLLDGWVGPVVDPDGAVCAFAMKGPNFQRAYRLMRIDPASTIVGSDVRHACLSLDLTRPEAADRAARVLAARVGLAVGATAPEWGWRTLPSGNGWVLTGERLPVVVFSDRDIQEMDALRRHREHIPALAVITDPLLALAAVLAHTTPTSTP